jgi:hypothetical protein
VIVRGEGDGEKEAGGECNGRRERGGGDKKREERDRWVPRWLVGMEFEIQRLTGEKTLMTRREYSF